jgi:hypothetical protein
MHSDQAQAADYDDPMCDRLLGMAADVLRSFGSAFGGRHLAIVGGAVPGSRSSSCAQCEAGQGARHVTHAGPLA